MQRQMSQKAVGWKQEKDIKQLNVLLERIFPLRLIYAIDSIHVNFSVEFIGWNDWSIVEGVDPTDQQIFSFFWCEIQ